MASYHIEESALQLIILHPERSQTLAMYNELKKSVEEPLTANENVHKYTQGHFPDVRDHKATHEKVIIAFLYWAERRSCAGFMIWMPGTWQHDPIIYVEALLISPRFRNAHLGSFLMRYLLSHYPDLLIKLDQAAIKGVVNEDQSQRNGKSQNRIDFYESFAFHFLEDPEKNDRPMLRVPAFPPIHERKRLADAAHQHFQRLSATYGPVLARLHDLATTEEEFDELVAELWSGHITKMATDWSLPDSKQLHLAARSS